MSSYLDLPREFIQRVREVAPSEYLETVLHGYEVKRPTTFRVNTLKTNRAEVMKELDVLGILYTQVPWFSDAFILQHDESRVLTESELYSSGNIYVQSLSSMIPPLLLDPQPGELVLDLCAAPGSKTTQLATMMRNEGRIIANDLSTVRIYKLAYNLKLQGVTNTKTRRGKGEDIWKEVKKRAAFDRVLADVPCSLEGRFSALDPKTYDGWSERKVVDLAQRMRYLLLSAVQSVRSEGLVVYSTCTLSPEENEGVVDWVLKKEGSQLEVVDAFSMLQSLGLGHDGTLMERGLSTWRGIEYLDELNNCVRIFPSEIMEGFFVCVLRRK